MPAAARQPLCVLALCVCFLCLCAAIRYARASTDRLDERLTAEVFPRGDDGRTHLQPALTESARVLGAPGSLIAANAGLVLLAAKRRDVRGCVVAGTAPLTAIILAEFVAKPIIDRRNSYGALLFPSGTVTAVAAVSLAACWLLRGLGRRNVLLLSAALFVAPTATVSLAVVALRWHLPTDAIGGTVLAAACVLGIASVTDTVWPPPQSTAVARPRRYR